jgi:hypothetical protein
LKQIDRIIKSIEWEQAWKDIKGIGNESRTEDDSRDAFLVVGFSCDGDAWIQTASEHIGMLRFRTSTGGGRSLRVRDALMILAMAIAADNEEYPQRNTTAEGG